MDYEINKPCLKSLGTIRKNLKKWLTFGREYKPLEDSSDLNFDKVKVSSIPDVIDEGIYFLKIINYSCRKKPVNDDHLVQLDESSYLKTQPVKHNQDFI